MSASAPEIRRVHRGGPAGRRPYPSLAVLLLAVLLPASGWAAAAEASPTGGSGQGLNRSHVRTLPPPACSAADSSEAVATDTPVLRAAAPEPPAPLSSDRAASEQGLRPDYRQLLATTALGHPRLDHWCVWIEPPSGAAGATLWETRWRAAVDQALAQWQQLLSIRLVDDPAAAQVRLKRRRPPLTVGPDGRRRASHGRATLTLLRVRRAGVTRLEPSVEVLLSPAQRQPAIAATALHELGHAFGLWGHSDDPVDAMAAVPGADPVLVLSHRDRTTLAWLYSQPTRFGQPLAP